MGESLLAIPVGIIGTPEVDSIPRNRSWNDFFLFF